MRRILPPLLLLALMAAPAGAQLATTLVQRPVSRFAPPKAQATEVDIRMRRAAPAFPVELVGATAGSLGGLFLGLLIADPDDCHNDDLACILQRLSLAGAISLVGAPTGTMLAGGLAGTRPNLPGAALGSIAGIAAGIGLLKLSEEIDDDPAPLLFTVIAYGGAHGLLTALGSRIGAAIRD